MEKGTFFKYVFADGDVCICKVTDATTTIKFKIMLNFDSNLLNRIEYDGPHECSIERVYPVTSIEEIRVLFPEDFI